MEWEVILGRGQGLSGGKGLVLTRRVCLCRGSTFDVHRRPTAASWLASVEASVPPFAPTLARVRTLQIHLASLSQAALVRSSLAVFLVHECLLLRPHVPCSN